MDDDPALLVFLERCLEDEFDVVTATDPAQALDLLRRRPFDLYLYDLCMDSLSGIELLLCTHALGDGSPVLLMTGAPTVERAVEALRAGATDLLLKPLQFDHLKARLREVLQRADRTPIPAQRLESIHEALRRTVEAKDPTTAGHGDRVRAVAHLIAHEMGLGGEDRRTLGRAAALHDIGKIGVPDAILCKPDRLSPDEFQWIRMHPEVGAKILEPLPEMAAVRECVLNHHERWDGTGYPRGLRGTEVSLPGRVLVLVEVFDALAHARSYKPAWSRAEVRDYFAAMRGRHFDPSLTDVFLRLVEGRFDALVQPLKGRAAATG